MLIDTHAHLNFEAYDQDRGDVIKRCLDYPMAVINIGAQYDTSKEAVKLSKNENFSVSKFQKLINEKTVAIGETGFDYFHLKEKDKPLFEVLEKQRQVLEKHIQLAKDNDLPLVCHGRNSKDDFALQTVYFDILKVLDNMSYSKGVVHCFSGTLHEAKSIVNAGMYLGFTGIITFPKTDELTYIIKETPLDKILIETDSPYLTPQEHRGKRNEPIYVMEVAQKIAEIKGIKVEELIKQVWENSKKLFKI